MKHKHLFLVIAVLLGVIVGVSGQAVALSGGATGNEDCVAVGDLDVGDTYTVEAWIYPTQLTGTSTDQLNFGFTVMASSFEPTQGYPLWITVNGTELRIWTFESTAATAHHTTSGAGLAVNNWYHIAVSTTKGGTTTVYVNGDVKLTYTNDGETNWNSIFTIGALRPERNNSNIPFAGRIDEVRVWNVVRTQQEIQDFMDYEIDTSNQSMLDSYGLVGYWDMNDQLDPTADGTANDNDGDLLYGASFGAGAPLGGPITLPVELSSFTAVPNAQYFVELHWTTQSETNVAGFRIYRSENMSLKDAVMFSTFIPATNTSVTQHYMFVDEEIYADGTYYYWLENVDMNGTSQFHGPVIATVIHGEPGAPTIVPTVSGIEKVYPNPFNPSTRINYMLDKDAAVSIKVYNVRGQLMSSLFDGTKEAGFHSVVWNGTTDTGTELPSGIYTVTVKIGSDIHSRRVVLSK